MKIAVTYKDTEFSVEISHKVHGKYRPATRECPEEYPDVEFEVDSATAEIAGYDIEIRDEKLLKEIEEHMIEKMDIASTVLEYESDRREYEREERFADRDW